MLREFEASVEIMLEKIKDHFGEKWMANGLQQDFYKITQGKNEKVRQSAGRLEAQFKWLKEKVPGRYDNNILKERFFHGMHLIQFCYKQEETMYEELFRETFEIEKEKVPEVKITSLKAKSAIAGEDSMGIQNLKQKINALTTMVKSTTFEGARPIQSRNGATPQKGKDNGKVNGSPYKGWGPATTSAGPLKPGQKHFQCYHCGGGGIVISSV